MKIMVFDVPAESGGALSVLHEFYNEFKFNTENKYIFVLSLAELKETSNINVFRYPWIKKSWFHRLYFDHFIAPKLIKKYDVDQVLSLQNVMIPHTKVYQSIFVHNALPFSEYRFKLKENKLLWIYQNIIGKNIMESILKTNHIIVQTNWMKNKIIEKLNIHHEKIEVKQSKIDIKIKERFRETKDSFSTFFYPASGVMFKNHKVIVDACLKLSEENINDYKVIFTLKGDENHHISNLYKIAKENHLPIQFIGILKREEVVDLYSKSILIFPSYIETVGLPLIEAMLHDAPIIVSNCQYAMEVLNNYEKKVSFDCFDHIELSGRLKEKIYMSKDISNEGENAGNV